MEAEARTDIAAGNIVDGLQKLNAASQGGVRYSTTLRQQMTPHDTTADAISGLARRLRDTPTSGWPQIADMAETAQRAGFVRADADPQLQAAFRDALADSVRTRPAENHISAIETLRHRPAFRTATSDPELRSQAVRAWLANPRFSTDPGVAPFEAEQLVAVLRDLPPDAAVRREVTAALPRLRLQTAALNSSAFRSAFPEFAERALAVRQVRASLATEPSRRLLEEDLLPAINTRPEFRVERAPAPHRQGLAIIVREHELREETRPQSRRTVVVPNHEVDILAAVLLLPRGASVLFDVVEGGAALTYAYEIVVMQDGRPVWDKLIRDTARSSWHRCEGMRAQNVFGGLHGFSQFPNQQAANFCNSSGAQTTPDQLRREAQRRIANEIASAPPIRDAIQRATSAPLPGAQGRLQRADTGSRP